MKPPLDIFSLCLQIWVAYNPVVNMRHFMRERHCNYVSTLTIHEVRNIVAGAPLLIASAQFGKNWPVTLTFFELQFLSNKPSECNSVFCSMLGLNYCFQCYIYYFSSFYTDKDILNQSQLCSSFFAECILKIIFLIFNNTWGAKLAVGAPLLIKVARFGKIWLVALAFFNKNFLSNEQLEVSSVFCYYVRMCLFLNVM